jgi:hypothetical protein
MWCLFPLLYKHGSFLYYLDVYIYILFYVGGVNMKFILEGRGVKGAVLICILLL